MNNQDLDDLLQRIRHLATHRPSPNFASNVWREIRKRKEAEKTNYRSSLAALLRPTFAGAAVGLALAIGICGGVLSGLNPNLSKLLAWKFFRRSHLPCHRLSLATCDEALDSTPVALGVGGGGPRHGEFCRKLAHFSRSTRLSVRAYPDASKTGLDPGAGEKT